MRREPRDFGSGIQRWRALKGWPGDTLNPNGGCWQTPRGSWLVHCAHRVGCAGTEQGRHFHGQGLSPAPTQRRCPFLWEMQPRCRTGKGGAGWTSAPSCPLGPWLTLCSEQTAQVVSSSPGYRARQQGSGELPAPANDHHCAFAAPWRDFGGLRGPSGGPEGLGSQRISCPLEVW